MKKIILVGGGGHAKACIDVIEQEGSFEIAGIVDVAAKVGQCLLGYPIVGTDDDLPSLVKENGHFLISVGQLDSPLKRIGLYDRILSLGGRLPQIVSPTAYVSQHSSIGQGTIVMHQAIVNAGAKISRNCIINTKALVEHDAVIGDHCHISTGATVNGGVIVGARTFVGSGAVTKEYITVPEDAFIRAGSLEVGD